MITSASPRRDLDLGAAEAMRYVVYLTIGYLVARGLAKSGSSERYDV